MPTLNWVGKDKVVNHHQEVPFKTLRHLYRFDAPDAAANSGGNRIIHGDNLEALKALLPKYEGRVKCIYIDPPYNTGNEGWVYNDNVNDPKLKKWLGQVVGKEGEDLSRHDKWLCMMYPRLKLLHRLLAEDGVIFVSIDDTESHNLRLVMNEIFGLHCWICTLIWKRRQTPDSRNLNGVSADHEYALCYGKGGVARFKGQEKDLTKYSNPDNDPLGSWMSDNLTGLANAQERPNLHYDIIHPITGKAYPPHPSRGWIYGQERMQELIQTGKILWPRSDSGRPRLKRYLSDMKSETTGLSSFLNAPANVEGTKELNQLLGSKIFAFPKPSGYIGHLIGQVTDKSSVILDSFAGSGTTAHAELKLNEQDGGNRRFILIETMDYAETITAERVRRVMTGYGVGEKAVAGMGGGFDYYEMGEALFQSDGNLNEAVGVEEIRRYVAYTEGVQPAERAESPAKPNGKLSRYLLGMVGETAVVFYYEPDRATKLDAKFLASLKLKPVSAIIYADLCLLDAKFLKRHNIIFKKIPREIRKF